MEKSRPNPDALLARIQSEHARSSRAKLKIFFGFAPGVGKTFRMLQSAQTLRAAGVDVVVGVVETHGRSETAALAEGLPLLPPLVLARGTATLQEFDLDAALQRKPAVLLLDELAHSNAPGARHTKRWQDVLELLDAGIEVHTTLNVQHVESLNDVVAQITHVQVRETVPDSLLERADDLELVDLSPDQLLARLRDGKVYLHDQAARAAQHFFQRGNLLALRELSLRQTADRVDADVQAQRADDGVESPWRTHERILVCVGPSPASARLVRSTRRLAAGLHAQWFAAYVDAPTQPMRPRERARLDAHLRLVEALGGTPVHLAGTDISQSLLDYARNHNITRLVIGKPTHSRLRDWIRGSVLNDVVRGSGDIDVHVISADVSTPLPEQPLPAHRQPLTPYLSALLAVGAATGLGWVMRTVLIPSDPIMLYLLGIVLVAVRTGKGPSLLAAALSVATYDFFFVPPFFTFAVTDGRHVLTFVTMFVVGAVLSTLTVRLRRQEQDARAREARTASLFSLSRDLAVARDEATVAQTLADHVARGFGGAVQVVARTPGGVAMLAGAGQRTLAAADDGLMRWVLDHGQPAGLGTETLPGADAVCLPLVQGAGAHAALTLWPVPREAWDGQALASLQAYARQGAVALERARLTDVVTATALRARTEEMRSSLLSAVSHDLRTPLAGITGAATTLRDAGPALPATERADMIAAICEEAERLEHLVVNLLDMTRLASGHIEIRRDWVPLEELTGAALTRLERALGTRPVDVQIPPDMPMVHVDPVLVGQLLVNLLENAIKYTPPTSPIALVAAWRPGEATIDVCDHGPGLPAALIDTAFDKFVRGQHTGVAGVGLGLAICKGIVDVHGGAIAYLPTPGGGATFRVTLPLTSEEPRP